MPEPSSELALRDFLEVLQRRKWIVIEVFAILVIVVAAGSFLQTPIYRATTVLLAETQTPTYSGRDEMPLVSAALEITRNQSVETHKLLITRRPVLETVIDDLTLQLTPKELREQLLVETFRSTDVIEVHADHEDPTVAAKIANSVADNYVLLDQEYGRASAESAAKFLKERLANVKEELAAAEEQLEQYKLSNEVSDLGVETRQRLEILGTLEEELAAARAEEGALFAQRQVVEEKLSQQERLQLRSSTEQPNPVVEKLETQLAQLEADRAGLLKEYTPKSQQVRRLTSTIDTLRQKLSEQLQTSIATTMGANPVHDELMTKAALSSAAALAGQRRVEALQKAVSEANVWLTQMPTAEKKLARLVRAEKVADRVYTLLLEKYHEVRVAEAMKLSNVRIVEPAVAPQFPIRPRKKLNLALACIFGLMLGIIIASLVEYLDDTIKDPQELAELLELPILGTVPRSTNKEKPVLVTHQTPKSVLTEAFRTLDSNLSFISVDHPVSELVITSATAGEGKSTIVANLAITVARKGSKVIVVDGDLRKPALHKFFEVDNVAGLSTTLVGERNADEVIQPTDVEGLYILPSGPLPPNPVELLSSDRMAQLCRDLQKQADLVLYDSPPVLTISDAAVLASQLDGVILVVEQGGPGRRLVTEARDLLVRAHGRIVGVVLNKKTKEAGRYYYYYSYYYSSEED